MSRSLRGILLAVGLVGLSAVVSATPIEITPAVQVVDLGEQVQVDILVTPDPGILVGAYDFLVNFDDSILAVFGVTFGTALGGPFDSIEDSVDLGGGSLNLWGFSLLGDLTTVQDGSSFVLASILFDTLAAGTSALDLVGNILSEPPGYDYLGDDIGFSIFAEPTGGSVTVNEVVAVPEPPVWALLITGFGLLLWRRKSTP